MSLRKPLVLDGTGQHQQLQAGDELQIPLADRVSELETNLNLLVTFLVSNGFEVPDELTTDL